MRDTSTPAHVSLVGSVIFTAKPHAHVVSKKSMNKYCANCGVPGTVTVLKKCGKCKAVHYCGEVSFNHIVEDAGLMLSSRRAKKLTG